MILNAACPLDWYHWLCHSGSLDLESVRMHPSYPPPISHHFAPFIPFSPFSRSKKKNLGLPHISEATDRQKRDGMCYENDSELYNDGKPYKITCR